MAGIAWIIGTAAVGVFLLLAAPVRGRVRLAGAALVGGAAVAGAFLLPSAAEWWPETGLLLTLLLAPLAAVLGGALWTTTAASPSRAVRGFALLSAGNCVAFVLLESYGAALASLELLPLCWLWPFARSARRTLSDGDGLHLASDRSAPTDRSAAMPSSAAAAAPSVPRALEPGLACAMGALLATGLFAAATDLTTAPDERDPEQRARRIVRERERRAARLAGQAADGFAARTMWVDQAPSLGVGALVLVCGALGAADVLRRFPAPVRAAPSPPDAVPVPPDRIELVADPRDVPRRDESPVRDEETSHDEVRSREEAPGTSADSASEGGQRPHDSSRSDVPTDPRAAREGDA